MTAALGRIASESAFGPLLPFERPLWVRSRVSPIKAQHGKVQREGHDARHSSSRRKPGSTRGSRATSEAFIACIRWIPAFAGMTMMGRKRASVEFKVAQG